MVAHQDDLIIFGGYADVPDSLLQEGSQSVRCRTNELHLYNLTKSESRV